ncbi:nitrous oxide-stimulated promoter family protein [Bacteroidota bacterium]
MRNLPAKIVRYTVINLEMKENIRTAMRYAGPRMFYRHPILSLLHYLDNRNNKEVEKEVAV